jgi:hypothetical protein
MAKTRHIHQRLNQRSIKYQMLDIVKAFGVEIENGEKTVLNKKSIHAALAELKRVSADMQKMLGRGGMVLVESGGTEITAYALDSYKRK